MRQLVHRTHLWIGSVAHRARQHPPRPRGERGDASVSQVLWIAFWVAFIAAAGGIILSFLEGKLAIMGG